MDLKVKYISCEKMHMESIIVPYGLAPKQAISNSSATRSIWLIRVSPKPISHSNGYHMHIIRVVLVRNKGDIYSKLSSFGALVCD